jgi:hypothetical protein
MAMDEVPQIRQDFEIMLRTLERKKGVLPGDKNE